MTKAKIFLGVFFLIVGITTTIIATYLLQEDRIVQLFDTDLNLKTEIRLLLVFSILLCYSGFKTIQKEYRKKEYKESELLDD